MLTFLFFRRVAGGHADHLVPGSLPQAQSGGIGVDQARIMAVVMGQHGHGAVEQLLVLVTAVEQWPIERLLVRPQQPRDQAEGFR